MQSQESEAVRYLKDQGIQEAAIGIIFGTGLHQLSLKLEVITSVPYAEIPGFSQSTVESHPGTLVYGRIADKKVLALKGRLHSYEGYLASQITFPIRVMKAFGVHSIFISNAAGALNPHYRKGEMMRLINHLDFQTFEETSDSGDMYDVELGRLAEKIACEENIPLHAGYYAAVPGPQLETRAEYRYLRNKGADAVGMSTVPEVKEAAKLKLRCLAVSVLTDECDPENLKPVTLEEIIQTANAADELLTRLFYKTILQC